MTSPIQQNGNIVINSDDTFVDENYIISNYTYNATHVSTVGNEIRVTPTKRKYVFRTQRRVPKTGVLIVGLGGNNGSTLTGGILANSLNLTWQTKQGKMTSNYFGSLTQATTTCLGIDDNNREVYVPLKSLLPMISPDDLVIGGWDINSAPLDEAMSRAEVFHMNLQKKLQPQMAAITPMKSIYYPDFIAANQTERADNIYDGDHACVEHLDAIRSDIRNFKNDNQLDKVIVLWSANTERFSDVIDGVHDSEENLLRAIIDGHTEISPSQMFAAASILEGCSFINGAPQNTFCPALISMSRSHNVFIGGDDFKSGQTKIKSALVDFLVSSGIKPESIVSYNHLGNNDGRNLSSYKQFRSKEISKSNVVDDMVSSNQILYAQDEHPDHTVVIKYVPYVQDSKRAMDEYISTIFMNGTNTIVLHNTCEDSLLAAPIIIDLIILCELFERIQWKIVDDSNSQSNFQTFDSILTILSFLLKAPLVPNDSPLVNAFFKQRACIENILRACNGLQPINSMLLQQKTRTYFSSNDAKKIISNENENHMNHF